MQEVELFQIFIEPLNKRELHYMVTGSVASIVYGEPRLTHDIDIVLEIERKRVQEIYLCFPDSEFYRPPSDVIQLENRRDSRGHFNIIHHESGYKADIYLQGIDSFNRWGLDHRRKIDFKNKNTIWLAPPEYVIIRKLQYFLEGGSDKHIRDIQGMMSVSGGLINMDELMPWIDHFQLHNQWKKVIR